MANTAPTTPAIKPTDPIDLTTSVAGEEDPGASIDIAGKPAEKPAFPMQRPEEGPDKAAGEGRPGGV